MWYWLLTAAVMSLVLALYAPGLYASLKAAANRQPGVRFLTAVNGFSLTFRPGLYTTAGLRWRKKALWWYCVWAAFVTVGVAIAWATGMWDPILPEPPDVRRPA